MTYSAPVRCGRAALTLVAPPAVEPVTPTEVKDRLGLPAATSDNLLGILIKVARQQIDGASGTLGRALIDQTWDLTADAFPPAEIKIPLPPLIEVVSVSYVDEAFVETTIDPLDYEVDLERGWVISTYGYSWPAPAPVPNAVRVRFRAGYGISGTDVPEPIRQWIVLNTGVMQAYGARSDPSLKSETIEGVGSRSYETSGSMAMTYQKMADTLLTPYQVWWM